MSQEFRVGDIMTFSQIISLEDKKVKLINNLNRDSSKSIMIDVLLMLLCERSANNPSIAAQDPNSD